MLRSPQSFLGFLGNLRAIVFVASSCIALGEALPTRAATIVKEGTSVISISGSLTSDDSRTFLAILNEIRTTTSEVIFVTIDSPGGSVMPAMAIGRAIRNAKAYVFVTPGAKCYSACVLVLASGVTRVVKGAEIGIHRPFLTSSPSQPIAQALRTLETSAKEYLREMNILEELADAMFSIPPSSVKVLTTAELERYRLVGTDQVYEEETDLRLMRELGVDRIEFNRRKGLLDAACSAHKANDPAMKSCIDRVMSGATPPATPSPPTNGSDPEIEVYFVNTEAEFAVSWKSWERLSNGTISVWTKIHPTRMELSGEVVSTNISRNLVECASMSLWATETHFWNEQGKVIQSVRDTRQLPAPPGSPGSRLIEIVCKRR